MHPINFQGAREIGKPEDMTDEQCYSLWAMPFEYKREDPDGNTVTSNVWLECWQPSKEDIEAINAGRPIWLQIHSNGLPPVALLTLDENGNSNND